MTALASPASAQTTAEAAMAAYDRQTRIADCSRRTDDGAVIVCGRRESDRHRLPPTPHAPGERVPGGAPMDLDEATSWTAAGVSTTATCGIFMGQRRCSKADMRASGWVPLGDAFTRPDPPEIPPLDPGAIGPR